MNKFIITRKNCLYNIGKMKMIEEIIFDEEPDDLIKERININLCHKCGSRLIWNDQMEDKTAGYSCVKYPFCDYSGLSFRLNPSRYCDENLPYPNNSFYLS